LYALQSGIEPNEKKSFRCGVFPLGRLACGQPSNFRRVICRCRSSQHCVSRFEQPATPYSALEIEVGNYSSQEGKLMTERTVSFGKFGSFLSTIFDEWVRRDIGRGNGNSIALQCAWRNLTFRTSQLVDESFSALLLWL